MLDASKEMLITNNSFLSFENGSADNKSLRLDLWFTRHHMNKGCMWLPAKTFVEYYYYWIFYIIVYIVKRLFHSCSSSFVFLIPYISVTAGRWCLSSQSFMLWMRHFSVTAHVPQQLWHCLTPLFQNTTCLNLNPDPNASTVGTDCLPAVEKVNMNGEELTESRVNDWEANRARHSVHQQNADSTLWTSFRRNDGLFSSLSVTETPSYQRHGSVDNRIETKQRCIGTVEPEKDKWREPP